MYVMFVPALLFYDVLTIITHTGAIKGVTFPETKGLSNISKVFILHQYLKVSIKQFSEVI